MTTPPTPGRCQFCGGPLRASPSPDFCSADHQAAWHQRRTEPAPAGLPSWSTGRWPTADTEREFRPSWGPPRNPHWRLPRRTGDHLRDRAAAHRARAAADTPDRMAAARLQLALIHAAEHAARADRPPERVPGRHARREVPLHPQPPPIRGRPQPRRVQIPGRPRGQRPQHRPETPPPPAEPKPPPEVSPHTALQPNPGTDPEKRGTHRRCALPPPCCPTQTGRITPAPVWHPRTGGLGSITRAR